MYLGHGKSIAWVSVVCSRGCEMSGEGGEGGEKNATTRFFLGGGASQRCIEIPDEDLVTGRLEGKKKEKKDTLHFF